MPGLTGGTVDSRSLDAMAESMQHEDWYQQETLVGRRYGLTSINHGEKDPAGHTVWRGRRRMGMLHGVISNKANLGMDMGEIVRAVLDRPATVLPKLDGPFVLACADQTGSFVVATDKLASRPCYYTIANGFFFGTELKALLTQLDDPQLDRQAVSDVLLMGYVIGQKTLLTDVHSLAPGTYVKYANGTVSRKRYWSPSFGLASESDYVEQAVDRYRDALANAVDSVSGQVGLWLSSGLDSRTMAAVLNDEVDSFNAYTYASHWGNDCEGAANVADALDIDHQICEYTASGCLDAIKKGVDLMDGMNQWSFYVNLPAALNDIPAHIDVLLEASGQGEFFGDVMNLHYLRKKTPVEAVYELKRMVSADDVKALITEDITPKASFRRVLETSPYDNPEYKTLDANWRIIANGHFRGNKLYRSQTGTRVPFVDGAFLDHIAKMPLNAYRQRTLPFTNGKAPYSVAPLKLQVMREVGGDVNHIPYDRTGLPPTYSLPLQAAGFVVTHLKNRFTKSRDTMQGEWYRQHPEMKKFINDLLEAACDRRLFDADAIRDIQQAHLSGKTDNMQIISALTTIELWRQTHLDQKRTAIKQKKPSLTTK
ncbi:asparagine synthase-related protein [Haladaptatus sp. NG-SE-30]